MLRVEADIARVIEKHAADIEQARARAERGEALTLTATTQQPTRETIRPDGGQVGDATQDQQRADER